MDLNIPNIDLPRVVIIGSGFAGLKFARTINGKLFQTVLIDKENYHTFQPLMYQVTSSGLEANSIVYPIRKALKGKKNFHFRMTEVLDVNSKSKEITTKNGTLKFDYLIIATGAGSNFFGMDNIRKHGYTMKNIVESLKLRNVILQNFETALNTSDRTKRKELMRFVIVGGGATGIELAGALADLKNNILQRDYQDLSINKMQIYVIEASERLLPAMSKNASINAEKFLTEIGVIVLLNTTVKDYDGTTVITNKKEIKSNTLIWSAGVQGNPIGNLDNSLNRANRIITDEFNQVKGYEDIYSIGDVSCIETEKDGRGHPMLGSIAAQQGKQLAKNFNASAKNKERKPFKYKDMGTMATIGRHKAVVDLPFVKFSGILAWYVWMFLHLMLLVGARNMLVVFIDWTWRYFKYDNSLRLIIGKGKHKKDN